MSDNYGGALFHQAFQRLLHKSFAFRIQGTGCLVEKQNRLLSSGQKHLPARGGQDEPEKLAFARRCGAADIGSSPEDSQAIAVRPYQCSPATELALFDGFELAANWPGSLSIARTVN